MKSKLSMLILSLFSVLLFITGFSDWVSNPHIETDNDFRLKEVTGKIDNYLSGSNSPYASYSSLEGAISGAKKYTDAGTVVNRYLTIGSTMKVENQALILEKNMNLFLPYEDKKCDIASENEIAQLSKGFIDTSAGAVQKYNASSLNFINSSLSINFGATLTIGGLFQETGVCGYYSQITLDTSSSIEVEGELTCNGYIKEVNPRYIDQQEYNKYLNSDIIDNSYDPRRFVLVKSGGKLTTPIALYDAGGSMGILTGLNDAGVFPISVFDFPCVQTYLRIEAGGKFSVVGRMIRSSGNQTVPVNETISIVKGASDSGRSLITLSTGYVSFEYCPLTPGYTNNDRSKTYLTINGTASLGFMSISIEMSGVNKVISTEKAFLPFSYKFRIYIGQNGVFSTNSYKMKLLPGAQMKLLKGGQLKLSGSLIAYKSNSLAGLSSNYPTDLEDAVIYCNGVFSMDRSATLGAHFSTTSKDGTAVLDLSKVSRSSLNASSPEGMSGTMVTIYSTGDFLDDESQNIASFLLKSGMSIKSDSHGNAYWDGQGSLISYTLSIVIANVNNYAYPTVGYQVYKYDSAGTETMLTTEDLFESESKSFILEKGESYKVISLDRADSTEFTKQNNSAYSFVSGNKYAIKGNTEITINSGEGILIRCSVSGASGSGGAVHKVYEKTSGSYNLIGTFNAINKNDVAVKKGATVKYWIKLGTQNFLSYSTGDHYLFKGIVDKTSAITKDEMSDGTKLATKSESGGNYSEVSNIQAECTIHQLIIKKEESGGCYAKGTQILMGDGTYKAVENLQVGEEIMIMNHDTGQLEKGIAAYIFENNDEVSEVMNLMFENGKNIEVLYGHCFFDRSVCKYVEIRPENVSSYISHEFYYYDTGTQTGYYTKLKSVQYYQKRTPAYAVVSAYHMNCVANGFINITDDIAGLYNYFDYDENLKYDAEQKQKDIEKYGLYSYSEWSDWFTPEEFELFSVKYLKISVGKGLLTEDKIKEYVERYFR